MRERTEGKFACNLRFAEGMLWQVRNGWVEMGDREADGKKRKENMVEKIAKFSVRELEKERAKGRSRRE